jgi:hypothetical protein
VTELVDDLFELAAILPSQESIDDLRRLAGTKELSDRLRRVFTPPAWARVATDESALAENLWFAILRELIDFVAVEIPQPLAPDQNGGDQWLDTLTKRVASLEEVSAQISRLLVAPRPDHEEVARIVHSFV